jgi:hypothetical protein
MGWSKTTALGDRRVRVMFSRRGAFRRHADSGTGQDETFRVSGKHLRLVLSRRTWDELSDEERDARLRERV